ncbi:hypothetical protein WL77_07615 [Burkholderia ubonensis]|nr:hypothetical protein WL77_07615 [Burkholderia ubonensis]
MFSTNARLQEGDAGRPGSMWLRAMRFEATRNDPRGTVTCTKRIVARASISMAAGGGATDRR